MRALRPIREAIALAAFFAFCIWGFPFLWAAGVAL